MTATLAANIERARAKGREAYQAGKGSGYNPWQRRGPAECLLWQAWLAGWEAAEADNQQANEPVHSDASHPVA